MLRIRRRKPQSLYGHLCKKGQTGNLWDATGVVTPFKLEILQARTVVLEDYLFFLLSTPFCYLFLAPGGVSSILQKPFTDSLRRSDEDGTPSGKKIVQYKLGSPIKACDLTSRSFHVDMHAALHDNENTGSAHSAPRKASPAR